MQKKLQRGFTLIELLVVIAIIGILAAVVLASLNDARSSGTNASMQQSMSNIRAQAEIVYNAASPLSYEGVCNEADIRRLMDAINSASSQVTAVEPTSAATDEDSVAGSTSTVVCHDSPDAYAVSTALQVTDGTQRYFCVDSSGNAEVSTTALAASSYVCP